MTSPKHVDPISLLTIAEIDSGSRHLKGDLIHAITDEGNASRSKALCIALWLLDRRGEPGLDLAPYYDKTIIQVLDELTGHAPEVVDTPSSAPSTEPPSPGPTESVPVILTV